MILKNKEITINEAIDIMKKTRVRVASGNVRDYETARGILIKAAGYRVPLKPLHRESGGTVYISGNCPACGSLVDEIDDLGYCHECGQKLSWD